MTAYQELKSKHQKEVDAFPLGFAFSNKQFAEMMEKWGLTENDTDKIYSIGGGGYVLKTDAKAMNEMFKRHDQELREFRKQQDNLYQMFVYEMFNHEYALSYDDETVLEVCGITLEELQTDKTISEAYRKARKYVIENTEVQ